MSAKSISLTSKPPARKRRSKDYFNKKIKRVLYLSLIYIILFGLAFMILYPYFTKLVTSFMSVEDLVDPLVMFVPRNPSLFVWRLTSQYMNLTTAYFNSFMLSLSTATIQMIVCGFIGYGFARFKFPGRSILFFFVIFTMMVPFTTVMLPYFLRFRFFNLIGLQLNLINTFWPFIILSATGMGLRNGLFVFVYRQYFRNMPKELQEAAYIDGAGPYKTFFLVMLPNAKASMLTVFLFAFCWQWTDINFTSVLSNGMDIVANIAPRFQLTGHQHPIFISQTRNVGILITIAPIALVYFIMQRFFIEGIERSGITS